MKPLIYPKGKLVLTIAQAMSGVIGRKSQPDEITTTLPETIIGDNLFDCINKFFKNKGFDIEVLSIHKQTYGSSLYWIERKDDTKFKLPNIYLVIRKVYGEDELP